MTKPGVVLRRPVGSDGSFGEHAELPRNLGDGGRPTKSLRKSKGRTRKKPSSRLVDKAAERKAALAFEKTRKRRERERANEEAAKHKARERRQQAVDQAQAALETAERKHAKESRPSRPRWRLSRRNRRPKTPFGKKKRSGWTLRCGVRGASRARPVKERRPMQTGFTGGGTRDKFRRSNSSTSKIAAEELSRARKRLELPPQVRSYVMIFYPRRARAVSRPCQRRLDRPHVPPWAQLIARAATSFRINSFASTPKISAIEASPTSTN